MLLEMYLDGEVIDVTSVVPFLWRTKSKEYLKSLVAEFEKKHADRLKKSVGKPCYCLSGVPSCINDFTPLRHPSATAPANTIVKTAVQSPAAVPFKTVDNKEETESTAPVEKMHRHRSAKVA